MKSKLEAVVLAVPLLGVCLSGCGGAAEEDDYSAALPTSESLTLQMDGLDADSALTAEALPTADPCHPHLFKRTANVVHSLNGILVPLLKRVDAALTAKPGRSGRTHSWVKVSGDEELRTTVTQEQTGHFTYKQEVKPKGAADSAYQVVFTGTFNADANEPKAGTGSLHVDLAALAQANPKEHATGVVEVAYTLSGGTKTLVVDLKKYLPDPNNPQPARDAHYVYMHGEGLGGSLKFEEHVALLCPSNPEQKEASVKTVARWMHKDGTTVVGRSDAMATGGQIAPGRRWMGLTCSSRAASSPGAERYWQMKLEGSDGNTVRGDATYSAQDSANPQSSCDAAFGAVPSLDTSATDFDFSQIDFTDSSPVALPPTT
jgi:hypothetical protein